MKIKIIQTGDIHGCFFPHNYLKRGGATTSLSHISSYIKRQRKTYGSNMLLLDIGDIMQGQPTCYRSFSISDQGAALAADILNRLGYDAVCIGNHDIETGHEAFDKWVKETKADVLAANVTRTADESAYFKPYKTSVIGNVKIVVLGLLTNAIPYWLSNRLWEGMRFENPIESAKKWMGIIKAEENPDIIIGLFHTGWDGGVDDNGFIENATRKIAEEVDGFDAILFGHDHIARSIKVKNRYGNEVICMNTSSNATYINDLTISIERGDNGIASNKATESHELGGNRRKVVSGEQIKVDCLPVDQEFTDYYQQQIIEAHLFCDTIIGNTAVSLRTRDCYFGDSPFASLIHNVQLEATGAQISFTAPLAYDESIDKGQVTMSDIFNIYKYENTIIVMKMTGHEVKRYLEYSYSLWINRMRNSSDRLMKISECYHNGKACCFFKNLTFNFDTAYGIIYTVDARKEYGNMIDIKMMSDGTHFDANKSYTVAMHSYRANGGNEFLTKGVGIPYSELSQRKLYETPMDEKYYIVNKFMKEKDINPMPARNWWFIPEDWTSNAIRRERKELFTDEA